MQHLISIGLSLLFAVAAVAQQYDIKELKLKDWEPRSMMKAPVSYVEKAKYTVIDAHNHLRDGADAERYIREMDAAGVQTIINLDGGASPEQVRKSIANLDDRYPGRFLTFALIDWEGLDEPGWSEQAAQKLEACFQAGAKGLKIHKTLGLTIKHKDGSLLKVDDPRIDPCWELCAKYKRPVMIHIADPAAFFTPLDHFSERWHELNDHPNWLFFGDQFPEQMELLEALNRVIERHPKTTFICAHAANNAEDLRTVAQWLDRYPNMVCDIDARISELGRQPYTSRDFLIKYQDRITFGTDTRPDSEAYRVYYRFLETKDEYWDCASGHQRQGFWNIYSVDLPDKVLKKIYYKNALKYLYGLDDYKKSFGKNR